jgi:hypothetical protein
VAKRPRAADPFADDPATAVAQPWHGESVAQRSSSSNESKEPFSTNFPPLHEWRGVRANSPVSLTVSSGRSPADVEASPPAFPVRQALATDEPTPGESRQAPLLARVEADRRQILERDQGTSLFGAAPQRGLARTANEPRPVEGLHTGSPQPAKSASRPEVAVAGPKLAKPASSRGSLVWWTLGLLALLTGGIALRSRSNSAHDD